MRFQPFPYRGFLVKFLDKYIFLAHLPSLCPCFFPQYISDRYSATGYNFPSLAAIEPNLEPTAAGPSTAWAKRTARRLRCIISVGYPEIASSLSHTDAVIRNEAGDEIQKKIGAGAEVAPVNEEGELPTNVHPEQEAGIENKAQASAPEPAPTAEAEAEGVVIEKRYNSTVTVSPTGAILAHYRKTHLYYTDESWATASHSQFLTTNLPLPSSPSPFSTSTTIKDYDDGDDATSIHPGSNYLSTSSTEDQNIKTTFGICMDLNPLAFTAPWSSYELATHTLSSSSKLLVVSMSWCTDTPDSLPTNASSPDVESLSYWITRLKPLVDAEKETVVVMGNRCGMEPGEEGKEAVRYVGTSWISAVGKGEVKIWGILGCKEQKVLVVDTNEEPKFRLASKGE